MALQQVVFVGTNHYHPHGPQILPEILDAIIGRYGAAAFIAVEAGRKLEPAIEHAKKESLRLLQEMDLDRRSAGCFAEMAAYEVDAALRATADRNKICWLLKGRAQDDFDGVGARMAELLAQRVRGKLEFGRDPVATVAASAEGGLGCLRNLEEGVDNDRELFMHRRLSEAISTVTGSEHRSGIVVIGASHIASTPGTLYSLCGHPKRRVWCERDWPMLIDGWLG